MKYPPLFWAPAIFLALIVTGCFRSPGEFGYDNPNIRGIQRIQSTRVIPSESKRQALARQNGKKVFFITSGSSPGGNSSGRAAAVSSDGYFLTAYHVVGRKPFFLSDATLTPAENKQLNNAGFLIQRNSGNKGLGGRLVWHDKGADLAIIKFSQKTPNYFRRLQFPAPVNEVIFASDDQGQIFLPTGNANLKDSAVGNGPFFSAGKVTFSQLFTHGPGVHTIGSNLVARGGMSGSPIVTLDGELCGILSNIGIYSYKQDNKTHVTSRSTSRMLPPPVLREIIAGDRAKTNR